MIDSEDFRNMGAAAYGLASSLREAAEGYRQMGEGFGEWHRALRKASYLGQHPYGGDGRYWTGAQMVGAR